MSVPVLPLAPPPLSPRHYARVLRLLLGAREQHTPLSSYDSHARASAAVLDMQAEGSGGRFAEEAAKHLQPAGFKHIRLLRQTPAQAQAQQAQQQAAKDSQAQEAASEVHARLQQVVAAAPPSTVQVDAAHWPSFFALAYPTACLQAVCFLDLSRAAPGSPHSLAPWCTEHRTGERHPKCAFNDFLVPIGREASTGPGAGAGADAPSPAPHPLSFEAWLAATQASGRVSRADLDPPGVPAGHTLLSTFIRFMLHRPEAACPLLVLLFPSHSHSLARFRQLSRTFQQEWLVAPVPPSKRAAFEVAIFTGKRPEMILTSAGAAAAAGPVHAAAPGGTAAAGASAASSSSGATPARARPVMDAGLEVLPTQSHLQLAALFRSRTLPLHAHLYQRLQQILASQLWGCPHSARMMQGEFDRLMSAGRTASSRPLAPAALPYQHLYPDALDDEEVYDALWHFFHRTIVPGHEYQRKLANERREAGQADGRANSRVAEITKLLGNQRPIRAMLDVGCSEGNITAALGAAMHLGAANIHGCDVRDVPAPEGFTFTLNSGTKLPYPDGSFDLVLALMALHHFEDLHPMMAELRRVLRPGGRLLIREHDCTYPSLAMVLDVMHGLYARTWKEPPEQPQFCEGYFAHYRARGEWQQLLTEAGFKQCADSPDRAEMYWAPQPRERLQRGRPVKNPFQFYYGIYEREAEAAAEAAAAASSSSSAARSVQSSSRRRSPSRSRSRGRDGGSSRHRDRRGSPTGRDKGARSPDRRRSRSRSRSRSRDRSRRSRRSCSRSRSRSRDRSEERRRQRRRDRSRTRGRDAAAASAPSAAATPSLPPPPAADVILHPPLHIQRQRIDASAPAASAPAPSGRVAFVTLVMLGDDYIPGALALAHSLRTAGTRAELVVLVSPDVSERGRAHLRLLFDLVQEVALLQGRAIHKEWKKFTQGLQNGQKIYQWVDYSFTKMHVLTLTQYDKVCLLDADMLCASPPDDLWSLPAPAGICSLFREKDPSSHAAAHGRPLTEAQVARAVESSYGIRGCLALLKPNLAHFQLLERVLQEHGGYGERRFHIGADEKLLTDLYLDQWTHVHVRFGTNSWKTGPEHLGPLPPVFLHYVTEKPWRPAPTHVKGGSGEKPWPDFFQWARVARGVVSKHPELAHYFEQHMRFMAPFITQEPEAAKPNE